MSSYCIQCGKLLKDAAKFCPRCGTPVEADSRCPHCGAAVEDDSTYCMNCGCWIAKTTAPPTARLPAADASGQPGGAPTAAPAPAAETIPPRAAVTQAPPPPAIPAGRNNEPPVRPESPAEPATRMYTLKANVIGYSSLYTILTHVTVSRYKIAIDEKKNAWWNLLKSPQHREIDFSKICFATNGVIYYSVWLILSVFMTIFLFYICAIQPGEVSWWVVLLALLFCWFATFGRAVTLYLKDGSRIRIYGKEDTLAPLFADVNRQIAQNGDNPRAIGVLTGSAENYYGPEFSGARNGKPVAFHVPAFLFGPIFCFYRRCPELFVRFYLAPLCLWCAAIAANWATLLYSTEPLFVMMAVIFEISVGIWSLIVSIRFGRSFNALYYQHCWKNRISGTVPAEPTSAMNAFLYLLACSMVIGCIYAAAIDSNFPDDLGDDEMTEDTSEVNMQSPEPAAAAAPTPASTPAPTPTKVQSLVPAQTQTPDPDPGPDERTDVDLTANNGTWYGEDGGTLDFGLEYLDDTRTKARITITFDDSSYYHAFDIETSFVVPDANEMIYYQDNATEGGWGGNYSIVIELTGEEIYFSAYPDEYTTENCGFFATFDSYRLTR